VNADPTFGSVSGLDREAMLGLFAERGGDPVAPVRRTRWMRCCGGRPAGRAELGLPGGARSARLARGVHGDRDGPLGPAVDVMGGGRDLVFPHHEMGEAHAQVHNGGRPFVRVFMHAGLVGYLGEKMSKSRGNLVFVSALRRAGVDPAAIRLALLAHHYASDWEYGRC